MIKITDGHESRSRTNSNGRQAITGRSRLASVCAAVLIAGLVWLPAARAQGTAQPANSGGGAGVVTITGSPVGNQGVPAQSGAMRVSLLRTEIAQQQLVLTTGRSAVVELSEPVSRVQLVDPSVVDATVLSPRQVLVTSKAVGYTQLVLWNEKEQQVTVPVVVELDLVDLAATIRSMSPQSKVEVRAIKDTVMLTGVVQDSDTAGRFVELAKMFSPKVQNQMRIAGGQQVLLRCTVAEVNKRAIRQLGVNGWIAGDNIRDVFAVNQLDGINPANIGAAGGVNILAPNNVPFLTGAGGLPLTTTPSFSIGFPRVSMQLFFQAMRENTLLRVLAEPNLVAMSGQEATFLAGGEFPVPIPQGISGSVTIEFKEFGVRLRFTPTVMGPDLIRLRVAPEVSEPDFTTAVQFAGFTIPGLTQRRAETTIELSSGNTIALAGLLSEQVRGVSHKLPALGDVPILGALFSSVQYQRSQTELVVLVTPELVSGMHPDQVSPVPGQFDRDPNDFELFGLGMVSGEPVPEEPNPGAALETRVAPRQAKSRTDPNQMTLHGPWGPAEADDRVQ